MLTRTLKLTSEDGSIAEEVAVSLRDGSVGLLGRYIENCNRLAEAQILTDQFPRIENIRWTDSEGLTFQVSDFSYSEVCEFLHLARPVFLAKEPASFEKACGVIGKAAGKGTPLAQHLKQIRSVYERGDYQPYFQITVGETPLFDESTLKSWLNGVEYHQDKDKESLVKELEEALSKDVARGIFVSQLSGRVRAVFMLRHLCSVIVHEDVN